MQVSEQMLAWCLENLCANTLLATVANTVCTNTHPLQFKLCKKTVGNTVR